MSLPTLLWAALLIGYVSLGLVFMRWAESLSGRASALTILPPALPFWWFLWSVNNHSTDLRLIALLVNGLLLGYWMFSISVNKYQEAEKSEPPKAPVIRSTTKPVGVEVIEAAITVVGVLAVLGAIAHAMEKAKTAERKPTAPTLPTLTPEQQAKKEANRLLHDRMVAGLPTDHDWWFANGEEFYTLYSGDWLFNHFRRHNAEPFGYSFLVHTNNRVTFDHYNERGEFIGWTDDTGARHTMSSNFPSGDKRWPLFRRYIQPYLNYQKLKE